MMKRSQLHTPVVETIFNAQSLGLISIETIIVEKVSLAFCMRCNPANGRVEFEDSRLIKSLIIKLVY
jgi:hypothetical protein